MATFAAIGERLLTLPELDDLATQTRSTDDDGRGFALGEELGAVGDGAKTPYQRIGIGKPLTITVEQVYLGNYPDTLAWLPGANKGDVLVTSAHKPFEQFAAAPRAIHMFEKKPERRKSIQQKATQKGSPLVFYSPAVTDKSTIFTLEMAVDRDFDEKAGKALGKAFSAAGALPVFATAAPFLIAAGVAIPLGVQAANLLARPNTFFSATFHVDFDRPGTTATPKGLRVVVPDGHEGDFEGFHLDKADFVLKDAENKPYDGAIAYMVLSFDGTERNEFKKWKATAVTAALTEQFFGGGDILEGAIDIIQDGLGLYNDLTFQKKAVDAKAKSDTLTGDAKDKELELYKAYKSNIQNEDLKATLG
jgi:hypothetical protein